MAAEERLPRVGRGASVVALVSREVGRVGVTSDLPTKVAPSSMTILVALRSPVSCELAFNSQRSVTVMFPSTVPCTVTDLVLTSPFT